MGVGIDAPSVSRAHLHIFLSYATDGFSSEMRPPPYFPRSTSLAVIAHIHHTETKYDEPLTGGMIAKRRAGRLRLRFSVFLTNGWVRKPPRQPNEVVL